jgi:hypothetical protein
MSPKIKMRITIAAFVFKIYQEDLSLLNFTAIMNSIRNASINGSKMSPI